MMLTVEVSGAELYLLDVPMTRPFAAATASVAERRVVLLRLDGSAGEVGWGECAALPTPGYTSEWADGAFAVLADQLLPMVRGVALGSDDVAARLRPVDGHPMATATVEMAVLDGELRVAGTSFGERFGATRELVDSGVSVGFAPRLDDLLDEVGGYVDAGYQRVKLKIEPGRDIEVVAAVRAQHPDVPLQADANGSYSLTDAEHLAQLDALDLLLLEQPLPPHPDGSDDLAGHAALAARLETLICLDESLTSVATTAAALDAGACEVVNLKPGRVGGYFEALRIHDLCVERGVPLWLGGMLETAVARAANLQLAALPGFTLPPDLSASDRYFPADVAEPFVLEEGRLRVPTAAGLVAPPMPDRLERFTVARRSVTG
jgi:o-succinylbenzoate synthase